MCGIAGTINRRLTSEDLLLLWHRGPDAGGLSSFDVGGHHVCLGHRRLSIVDLSEAGGQPMTSTDGTGCLVFNGEIYNHAELRSDASSYPYRGHSDTETILALFQKYGPECLERLNGIFALAYLDVRGRALFVARDPFGVKPVYWTATKESFALSSEIRGLSGPREVASDHLPTLLRLRHLPSPLTLWKDVWKVPPGHYLRVNLGAEDLSWTFVRYGQAQSCADLREDLPPQIRFEETLERSVSRQLMSDVDIGVFLSGGFDSTLIAHYAQKHYPGKLRSYTVGYDQRDIEDETREAEGIARVFGLEHRTVRVSEDTFHRSFSELVDIVEEPVASSSMIPLHALARAASEDIKVVLSGQGADEVSGGYARYRASTLIEHLQRARMCGLAGWALHLPGNWSSACGRVGTALRSRTTLSRYISLTELFSVPDVYRLTGAGADTFLLPPHALDATESEGLTNAIMGLDACTALPDELLMYTDKVTMHHSLECRVPFLDLQLASLLASFRGTDKVGVMRGKKLQARTARRLFPGIALTRGKKGFLVPRRFWCEQSSQTRHLLTSADSHIASFMDIHAIRGMVDEFDRGRRPAGQLFTLAALAFWFENNHKKHSAGPQELAAGA